MFPGRNSEFERLNVISCLPRAIASRQNKVSAGTEGVRPVCLEEAILSPVKTHVPNGTCLGLHGASSFISFSIHFLNNYFSLPNCTIHYVRASIHLIILRSIALIFDKRYEYCNYRNFSILI
jgi:hypothetical protein